MLARDKHGRTAFHHFLARLDFGEEVLALTAALVSRGQGRAIADMADDGGQSVLALAAARMADGAGLTQRQRELLNLLRAA